MFWHENTEAEVLGRYFHTTQVELLDLKVPEDDHAVYEGFESLWQENNGFVHVRVDGKEGYILSDHLQPLTRLNLSA